MKIPTQNHHHHHRSHTHIFIHPCNHTFSIGIDYRLSELACGCTDDMFNGGSRSGVCVCMYLKSNRMVAVEHTLVVFIIP